MRGFSNTSGNVKAVTEKGSVNNLLNLYKSRDINYKPYSPISVLSFTSGPIPREYGGLTVI
jgi:hypothetical protein